MIGIIAALPVEAERLLGQMDHLETETVSGIAFTRGTVGGGDVVCAVCGIGKVFSALCAQTMILRYAPELVINTGVAGTLSPLLHIGSIAIAEDVVQHDVDLTPLNFPPAVIPGVDRAKIPCDRHAGKLMAACAEEGGLHIVFGTLVTGDSFISSGADKERLSRDFGGIACDMEGGSIGQVCFANHTPFLVIRSISDEADGKAHADYGAFMKSAARNSADTVLRFLRRL